MITYKDFKSASVLSLLCSTLVAMAGCGGPLERQARHEKRAQEYLAAGQLDKARVEFRNALQLAPNNSRLRYENGLVEERLGNVRAAAGFYGGAIESNSDNIEARAHLATMMLLAGLPDEALKQVNPGLAKHPDDVGLLIVHANALALKNDRTAALEEAQRTLALSHNSEDAITSLAGIQIGAKRLDDALKLVQDALGHNPQSVTLRRVAVEVCVQRKDPACAEHELLELVKLQPHEKLFRLQLAQVYARTDQLDDSERTLRAAIHDIPGDSELKTELVEFLWSRRGHDVAEAELQKMITAAPKEYALRLTLASFYEQSHDLARAEAEYRDLIEKTGKGPDGTRARDRLAVLYTEKNDIPAADKLIGQVLQDNPGDNEALVLRANEEVTVGQPDAAITDLRRVLRDQPNSPEALLALTRAYVVDGEPQLAEDAARHAVEADPSNMTARIELARALIRTGKFDQGRTVLYALQKQKPDDPVVLDLLFRASTALNDMSAAQAAATDLLKITPNAGIAQVYLGIVEETKGHLDEALADYRKAFELQPHAFEPLHAIVLLLQKEKHFDEAVALLDDVAQRDPKSALALNMKGSVLLKQENHLPQAEAAFRAASQRAPKWWDPYSGLATIQLVRRDVNGAASVLEEAAARCQLGEPQRLDLAALLAVAGEPEKAIEQYETVLKANPKSQVAAGGLALLLVSYRTDEVSLNRATTLVRPLANSGDWRLLDAFGWVHFKSEDIAAALPALEKASAQRPDASVLRFHLGMAQLRAGHAEEAEKNLAVAVGPDDHFLGRDEAKAVLAQLRSRRPT